MAIVCIILGGTSHEVLLKCRLICLSWWRLQCCTGRATNQVTPATSKKYQACGSNEGAVSHYSRAALCAYFVELGSNCNPASAPCKTDLPYVPHVCQVSQLYYNAEASLSEERGRCCEYQ